MKQQGKTWDELMEMKLDLIYPVNPNYNTITGMLYIPPPKPKFFTAWRVIRFIAGFVIGHVAVLFWLIG